MGRVLLFVVLFGVLGAVAYVYRGQTTPPTPRSVVEKAMAETLSKRKLAAPERELLRIQLALADFTARKGTPPDTLGELVPTYFEELPKNPETKEPFPYRREGHAFVIGDTTAAERQSSAQKSGESATSAKEGSSSKPLSEEEFVNPNTMKEDTFVYDSTGKRDPFVPFDMSKKSDVRTPLTAYSLTQLRVSAILMSNIAGQQSTAIVEDSSGKGFTVRVGTAIGNENGTVASIEPTMVKVLERSTDFTGKETTKLTEMKLEVKPAERAGKPGQRRRKP